MDYQNVFENMSGRCVILSPDFRILGMTRAYLTGSMRQREELIGKSVFEAFPDNPDDPSASGAAQLRTSLTRAISTGLPDRMPQLRYDIRKPASEGGAYEKRWWRPLNTPIHDASGKLLYIIHEVEDVTSRVLVSQLEAEAADQERLTLGQRATWRESEAFPS